MQTLLISIISEQTVPNVLLINEFKGKYDDMVFITSFDMEKSGKSNWIEQATGIEIGSVPRIVVNENSWSDISEKLIEYVWPENSIYLVNQTGGTKIMTLAVFEFFAKNSNRIVYSPIGKNQYDEIYPSHDKLPTPINFRLNLKDYLLAHGLYFQSSDEMYFPFEHTKQFFSSFRNRKFNFYRTPEIIDAHQLPTEQERVYYSGRWFEEFVYETLKSKMNLGEDQISMNVKLFRRLDELQHDNEFDVMFTKDNSLYVIECKASVGGKNTIKDKMDHYLHKLGAITRDFGLRVNSYIFTLTNIHQVAAGKFNGIDKRRKILGIRGIFDAPKFYNIDEIVSSLTPSIISSSHLPASTTKLDDTVPRKKE